MNIIGFCNPLLDISLNNHSSIPELLQKYRLKDNDIIIGDRDNSVGLDGLVKEITNLNVEYSAGGAGMNSLRCAQVILPKFTCRIVGSIGRDDFGRILTEKAEESGLLTSLQTTSEKPSGKCACLIHGKHRSLVAYLGAANDFSPNHLDTLETEIAEARLLYITGFFYSVSPVSLKQILNQKPAGRVIFNLSATFVPDMMTEVDLNMIMESVYLLIGNHGEFEHLMRKFRLNTLNDLSESFPEAIIIETDGEHPIKLYSRGQVTEISIPQIAESEIVDTNGAGDAFVGGILAGLYEGKELEESIKLGSFMAACVIKRSGTNPPSYQELEPFFKTSNYYKLKK